MGFQMQICSILCFSWSILVKCFAPAKLKCFFYRRIYSTNIDCFVIFSTFTFDFWSCLSICLSFVNNSQNNVTTPLSNQRLWPYRFYVYFRSLIMPSKSFVSSLLRNTKSSLILGGKKFSNPNFHDGICFRCWMGYNFLVKHNIALPLIFLGNIQMGFYWLKFSAI